MTMPYVSVQFKKKEKFENKKKINFQEPQQLRENTMELVATMLACGIDEKKSKIFLQSQVAQHTELQWIFTCLSTNARLAQLPQFKEKAAQTKNPSTGLFMYPILQAADILVHK